MIKIRFTELEICIVLGYFEYLKNNFANAPTPDLSSAFLSALVRLMLAQAQECELELKMLGGFEIALGKCVAIAQAAMTVSLLVFSSWYVETLQLTCYLARAVVYLFIITPRTSISPEIRTCSQLLFLF